MGRRLAVCVAATFVVAFLLEGASAKAAAPLIVDQSDSGCTAAASPFCTIQEGVDAAAAGMTVLVEPGTYTEQVSIGAGKDNLKLLADGPGVSIAAPASLSAPGAIVRVTASAPVRIAGFTITGPGGAPCSTLVAGIRVDGGGKAFIVGDHITAIRDTPVSGCQNGVGIVVGRSSDQTSGSAVITDTTIDDYQKGGVTVSNAGSFAFLRGVAITGRGPTSAGAVNGLQVSSGAGAVVRDVQISGNIYSPTDNESTGVLLFNPGVVFLGNVTATSNEIGVAVIGTHDSKFVGDTVTGSTIQGFVVDDTSSGNVGKFLTVTGNVGPDIEDDSSGAGTVGTANHWRHNTCGTSTPAGLCE